MMLGYRLKGCPMNPVESGPRGTEVSFRELPRGEESCLQSDLFKLLTELRPGLSDELFRQITSDGYAQGLRYIVAYSADGKAVAAAGFRVLFTSRGRILYVDDLVTAASERSRGVAAAVMNELLRRARLAKCDRLELDSGVTNSSAHRFYLRNRLDIRAFHFGTEVEQ